MWLVDWAIDRVEFRRQISLFETKISRLTIDILSIIFESIENLLASIDIIVDKLRFAFRTRLDFFFFSFDTIEEMIRLDLDMINSIDDSTRVFTKAQKREMTTMIAKVFRNHGSDDDEDQNLIFLSSDSINVENYDNFDYEWKSNDIKYFDLEYDDLANVDSSIVNAIRHVFYRNVYAFVDRLKNMTILREKEKLRIVLSQCFRDFALIWHFMKLSNFEKQLLCNVDLKSWYKILIHRFKKRTSIALQHL